MSEEQQAEQIAEHAQEVLAALDAQVQEMPPPDPLVPYDDATDAVLLGVDASIPEPSAEPPIRKCSFAAQAGPVIDRMAQMYPSSPVTRAHIMSLFGEMPPAELDTYKKLVDWVEFKFDKAIKSVKPAVPVQQPARNTRSVLTVVVDESETELGRCQYSVTRSRVSEVDFTRDELMEFASTADDMDEIVDAIRESANENCEGDWETDHDTYDYEDHDSQDSRDYESETREFRSRLHTYLLENLSTAELERLGLE